MQAVTVDLLDGGWRHDIQSPVVFDSLLSAVTARAFDVAWVALHGAEACVRELGLESSGDGV
ncbi:MAG: hypothetical protein SGPRY_007420 [Prymnesium sp.]